MIEGNTIVRKDHVLPTEIVYKPNYDSKEKQRIRDGILKYIPDGGSVVTMPAEQGLCVKTFLSKTPNITTIERDPETFLKYAGLGYNTKNFLGTAEQFFLLNDNKIDLFYFDSVGYVCQSHLDVLDLINKRRQAKTIAYTCMDINDFRSQGAKLMRERFKDTDDAITSVMNNYEVVEVFRYKMENKKNRRGMRVYILKLKREDRSNEVYGRQEQDFEGFSINLKFNF